MVAQRNVVDIALGIVCARYRDVPQVILSVVQLVFLISPILWRPEDVPENLQAIAALNPLSYFLVIVRNPLLGVNVPMLAWVLTLSTTVVGWIIAVLLLRSYRTRVVYWV